MGRADVVAASMLPATSEAFGAVRRLRPAVSRDAPGTRKPQASNVSTASRSAHDRPTPRPGMRVSAAGIAARRSCRQTPCDWRG